MTTSETVAATEMPGDGFRVRVRRTTGVLALLAVAVMMLSALFYNVPEELEFAVVGLVVGAAGGALLVRPGVGGGAGDLTAWLASTAAALGVYVAAVAGDPSVEGPYIALFLITGVASAGTTIVLASASVAVAVAAVVVVNTLAGASWAEVAWQPGALIAVGIVANVLSADLLARLDRSVAVEREAARRAELMTLVADAARRVSTLDPDALIQQIVETALLLGFDSGNVSLFSDDLRTYRVLHPRGFDVAYGGDEIYAADVGMAALVIEAGATVSIEDYEEHPRALEALKGQGYRCTVGTPIHVHGNLVGALVVGRKTSGPLSAGAAEAVELLAALGGRALENARRFSSEQAAVERLERLDGLKSDFVSNVSHELRTPLTIIEGIGVTLRDRAAILPEELRSDLLRRLVANAGRLTEIVTRLLDFTRIEAGTLKVELDDVDLYDVLEVVVVAAHTVADEHAIVLRADAGLPVRADPMLIERVVENLVNNAFKHTPAGTTVVVRAWREDARVHVEVSDDGPGISFEDQRHLFDRFFRGGEANTRETGGLGLGLAFADELVRLHGSELSLASEPGHGTAFRFDLPLAAPNA